MTSQYRLIQSFALSDIIPLSSYVPLIRPFPLFGVKGCRKWYRSKSRPRILVRHMYTPQADLMFYALFIDFKSRKGFILMTTDAQQTSTILNCKCNVNLFVNAPVVIKLSQKYDKAIKSPLIIFTAFLGKTPLGVLPYCHRVRQPTSLSLSSCRQSEAVVYLENGLT